VTAREQAHGHEIFFTRLADVSKAGILIARTARSRGSQSLKRRCERAMQLACAASACARMKGRGKCDGQRAIEIGRCHIRERPLFVQDASGRDESERPSEPARHWESLWAGGVVVRWKDRARAAGGRTRSDTSARLRSERPLVDRDVGAMRGQFARNTEPIRFVQASSATLPGSGHGQERQDEQEGRMGRKRNGTEGLPSSLRPTPAVSSVIC